MQVVGIKISRDSNTYTGDEFYFKALGYKVKVVNGFVNLSTKEADTVGNYQAPFDFTHGYPAVEVIFNEEVETEEVETEEVENILTPDEVEEVMDLDKLNKAQLAAKLTEDEKETKELLKKTKSELILLVSDLD